MPRQALQSQRCVNEAFTIILTFEQVSQHVPTYQARNYQSANQNPNDRPDDGCLNKFAFDIQFMRRAGLTAFDNVPFFGLPSYTDWQDDKEDEAPNDEPKNKCGKWIQTTSRYAEHLQQVCACLFGHE